MRNVLLSTAAAVGALLLAASSSTAASYIPVPSVPNSVSMIVFGINNDDIITGSYRDSAGIEHGFVGPLDGSNYTTFDFGGASTGTEPRAINQKNEITGIATGSGFSIGEEFYRRHDGAIRPIMHQQQPMDGIAQGINGLGTNVGDFYDKNGIRVGYYGVRGRFQKLFNLHIKDWVQNSPRGITGGNTVDGYFIDNNGAEHGFIQTPGTGTVQVIDYPDNNAVLTVLEDINEMGLASGQWNDTAGNPHAFLLDTTTGNFTVLDPGDGSTFQQAWSMNGKGLVALSTSNGTSYIYCPYAQKQCPKNGKEAKVKTIHVAGGTFLHYDSKGRTGRGLAHANAINKKGAVQ